MIRTSIGALAAAVSLAFAPVAHAGFDAAAAWSDFLQGKASYDDVNAAYNALGDVGYHFDGVDAAKCGSGRAALDAAVSTVPVSFALRHAAMLCAEARHDTAQADEQMQAIAVLTRHGLDDSGDGAGAWTRPVRVVRPEDVEAFVTAAGYEARYAYFPDARAAGGFPLVQVMAEPGSRQERHVRFDWVDTLGRLRRDSDFAGYPYDREVIAGAFIDHWATDDDIAWVDIRAVRAAMEASDSAQGVGLLRGAAARGGPMSALMWMQECRTHATPHCADGLVDALLPSAEKGEALARVVLALAYEDGIGIARDPAAARTLVESADAAWTGHGASTFFAATRIGQHASWPAWLEPRLRAASSDAGVPALLALHTLADRPKSLSPAEIAVLEAPENNRTGRGLHLLSLLDDPRAADWRARAAAAGSAEAQRDRALQLLQKKVDDADGLSLLRQAAMGGDTIAARALGGLAGGRGDWAAAEGWWIGAAYRNDVDTLIDLASLYADAPAGVKGDAARATRVFEALSESSAAARRRYASALLGHTKLAPDPQKARRLLERDAGAGDVESQMLLAQALADGGFGKAAPDEARTWFEKAVATGSPKAKSDYGMWLYAHEPTLDGRRRGLALVREAADTGDTTAINNVAWVQCVSPDAELRDAAAGRAAAAKLGAVDVIPPGWLDTVAACEAANGDFDRARVLQASAVAKAEAITGKPNSGMRKRQSLYAGRHGYIEPRTP